MFCSIDFFRLSYHITERDSKKVYVQAVVIDNAYVTQSEMHTVFNTISSDTILCPCL